MNERFWKILSRVLIVILGSSIGYYVLPLLWDMININISFFYSPLFNIVLGAIILFLIYGLTQPLLMRFIRNIERDMRQLSIEKVLVSAIGVIIGLVLAWLINIPLVAIGWPFISNILPIVLTIVLGVLGFYIFSNKSAEIMEMLTHFPQVRRSESTDTAITDDTQSDKEAHESDLSTHSEGLDMYTDALLSLRQAADEAYQPYKILDTSVIIDGRILDVLKAGFIEGVIVVPNFVLKELQYIADSADSLKRVRGRRGLDILNQIQALDDVIVDFYAGDFDDESEVDLKLLRLAKLVDGVVVTNDYNLNKVSQFHKIKVLNINELANSLKSVVIPGETISVHIVKAGTERQQGVAYMDDGTMIVVEEGKHHIEETLSVEITSAIQTNAGRMVFAKIAD
ncbi:MULTISPECIES: PIN/TRAM domain-containing protein [unclassified Carnobacterium]|uniref:PIN/TRAM domain-containing protein n=1 Tax=unclassified Carnobacterium TaxID=257487 RepID=UPI000EE109ED|nr:MULTISPECIES: PIN domain-containing protein [unclassified Carnobacterium]KAF3302374.1 PIN domain nuclease [Carnobacterium sp. PL26RED25]KAF3304697.1 PIN domain nuclease [Carnobacterium sp. PL17GRE32]KAF3306076.1 PIN domain nuclease [Carnobacterium sp. PL24RED07]HCT97515.1 PIN domain nuclease [Aerococcus urinaeequi]